MVDTLTGENKILRVDILHDVGASLNPAIDIWPSRRWLCVQGGWLVNDGRVGLEPARPLDDQWPTKLQNSSIS
ncbi:molybdopterin-dependent oxidoreductase [Vibrio lentus]|nr:molybdopterin-dependent oxidoreductase [Vibrio lentus]